MAVTHKAPLVQRFHFLWKTTVRLFVAVCSGISGAKTETVERISQRNIIRKNVTIFLCQMPSLNWLGRAQNKNVLKPIFLYGSSLSVLPKVMNHWVNQTGFLWFLICLPLISWVACRDLIWDCLPFLYGSVESDGAEQEHFPVAAQGHAVPRDRLRNRICARCFFFRASFPEFASQAFCHLFVVPPAPNLIF